MTVTALRRIPPQRSLRSETPETTPPPMSKKSLNKANLTALGAERLAELLLEVTTGNAALQRRLRLELSAAQGPKEVAREVRKRFAALRRSTSFVDWRGHHKLVQDLETHLSMIVDKVAPDDPETAFDLLWAFLELAPSIHERADDSHGDIGDVFRDALAGFEEIGPRAAPDPEALAERIFAALMDNDYGQFDGLIDVLGETLGEEGLERLKALALADEDVPRPEDDENEEIGYLIGPAGIERRRAVAADMKRLGIDMILRDIADQQGDVDAYMERYRPDQLRMPRIAAEVAQRLLRSGRNQEAFEIVAAARTAAGDRGLATYELDQVHLACLVALGRTDEAQAFRWASFERTLNPNRLREFLKELPDFEDIEAEERAKAIAFAFPHVHAALTFLVDWPDHAMAARLVEIRSEELDGDAYHVLTPAAEALDGRHSLAATLARRAMILFTLTEARSTRYKHAARHLLECEAADRTIDDYGEHPDHATFVEALWQRHGRKQGFWGQVQQ